MLDLFGEHLGNLLEHASRRFVGWVWHTLEHIACMGERSAHGVCGRCRKTATDANFFLLIVEGPAFADEEEDLVIASLLNCGLHSSELGVVVVESDLTTVDAAEFVALGDQSLHRVGHFVAQAWRNRKAGVVAAADGDRILGDACLATVVGVGAIALAAWPCSVAECWTSGRNIGSWRGVAAAL
ncbi:unannotated protein [freshwater metagenome]|uniref:Unannotated protein n=1 Tax=freshwater metagenome TaxID=449393 RepID=A0A6J6YNR9_9ZZZZ